MVQVSAAALAPICPAHWRGMCLVTDSSVAQRLSQPQPGVSFSYGSWTAARLSSSSTQSTRPGRGSGAVGRAVAALRRGRNGPRIARPSHPRPASGRDTPSGENRLRGRRARTRLSAFPPPRLPEQWSQRSHRHADRARDRDSPRRRPGGPGATDRNRATRMRPWRVIATSSRDLAAEAQHGRLRTDLYAALSRLILYLPPLRQRRCDIPALVRHFLEQSSEGARAATCRITDEALVVLWGYDWPGNIAELEAVVRTLTAVNGRSVIHAYDLPPQVSTRANHRGALTAATPCFRAAS